VRELHPTILGRWAPEPEHNPVPVGEDPAMDAPTGADAVIPEPARFGGLRLALLRLRARGRVRVEGRVTLERDVAIRVAKGARVVLGDGVHLGSGCRLEALEGTLRLGARTLVGPRAFVVSLAGMEVGEDCTIGGFAGIGVPDAPGRRGPVTIGERARIAAHATVASGATVAPGTVLASYEAVR
jgi:acetyltransferase-like isoleucine patch superfamily enzyme